MIWVIILIMGLSQGPRHAIFEGTKFPDQKACIAALNEYVEALKDEPSGTGICTPVIPENTKAIGKEAPPT